jgi:Tetratricopeptide repeat
MNLFLAKKWPPFLLLGMATVLVWGHTVTFDFVWDDEFFIRDLTSVRSLKHVPEMFYRPDAQATRPNDFRVFRPIRTASYALLHFLGGKETPQPWIYHLANVLGHGGTAMMLFAALTLLLPQWRNGFTEADTRWWSFFIALAFAVHPVVSEVVCWAKSLDDILAAFFTLAALRELLLPPGNRTARWRGLLFFALAVYSKESAVPFVAVALVIFRKIHHLGWRQSISRTAWFLMIAVIYLANRHFVIGRSSQTAPISGSYGQTLIDMLPVVPKYFRLLWGVPPFFIDYSYLPGGCRFWSPEVLAGLALLIALTFAGVIAWRKSGWELAGFGLLWTGLFLLPVSNLLPMLQYLAERFLYLPLIGWLIASAAIVSACRRQSIIRMTAFVVIVLWAVTAWNRSWIWRDPVTLFVRSSQEGPHTQRVEDNAVSAIIHLPQVQRFFSSNETNTVRTSANIADGSAVLNTLEQAYHLFPTNHVVLSYYGTSLALAGQPGKALPFLEKAAQLQPQKLDYWLNLARAALDAGQPAPAQSALEKAAALAGDSPAVLQLRFKFCWQTEDYPAAREIILRLNQIAPDAGQAYWLSEVEKKLKTASPPPASKPSNPEN